MNDQTRPAPSPWEAVRSADYAETLGFRGGFFNRALRGARVARGLTQQQLGTMAGTSGHAVSQAETLRAYPATHVAERICSVLGIPVETLFPAWMRELQQTSAIQELPPDFVLSLDAMLEQAPKAMAALSVIDVEGDAVDRTAKSVRLARLNEALDSLTPREMRVVAMHFGLRGEQKKTLKEIGVEFGATGGAIRAVEDKALHKLRHPRRSRQLLIEARDHPAEVAVPMRGPFACRWPRGNSVEMARLRRRQELPI